MTQKTPPTQHPAEHPLADTLDHPATAATAARVIEKLGLTEREAQSILAAPEATIEQRDQALRMNLAALGAVFTPETIERLRTDPKLEVSPQFVQFPEAGARLHTLAGALEKLEHLDASVRGAALVDADLLQRFTSATAAQLRQRAASNPAVRTAYGALLAYHHARYPGSRTHHGPEVQPSSAKNST